MNSLPTHVAVIMDGNGRWAEKRGLPRSAGHVKGVAALKKLVAVALEYEIKYVTVFAFSAENWKRPKEEIGQIMSLIADFNKRELKRMLEADVRVRFLGSREGLSADVLKSIVKIEEQTKDCTSLNFNIAFNYSGQADVLQAVNKAVEGGKSVSADEFEGLLYTKDIPAPDVIFRTGGEFRLSNFMLFQAAYAELIFSDKYWPDFNKKTFEKVLAEYAGRKRRFGGAGTEENNA